MKRIILMALAVMLFAVPDAGAALGNDSIRVRTVIDTVTIAASGTANSDTLYPNGVDLDAFRAEGFLSVEIYVSSGSGTCKIEYQLSYDGINWVDAGTDIATGITLATDRMIYGFPSGEPVLAPFIRFVVTETGGANSITIKLRFGLQ